MVERAAERNVSAVRVLVLNTTEPYNRHAAGVVRVRPNLSRLTCAAGVRVAPEYAVGHRRAAVHQVVHPAAVKFCRVAAERAVGNHWATVRQVVHPAAVAVDRVTDERAVGDRWAAVHQVAHPTTFVVCRVSAERAVGQRRAAVQVVHPAAIAR